MVRLADGAQFFSSLSAPSVLSAAAPEAFGFLGPQSPAPITLDGSVLQAPAVSLIGGEVTLTDAALMAPGGRLQVASAVAAGEVPLDLMAASTAPVGEAFDYAAAIALNGSGLITSGDGGGTVVIRGGRLRVANGSA